MTEIKTGLTHRELYPEQYEHPYVGKRAVLDDGTAFIVARVVNSRFGLLAITEADQTLAYSLDRIAEVAE